MNLGQWQYPPPPNTHTNTENGRSRELKRQLQVGERDKKGRAVCPTEPAPGPCDYMYKVGLSIFIRYITKTGRLRVKRRDEELPPDARSVIEEDEYIDEHGIVRRDRRIRKQLDAAPPVDFEDVDPIPLPEEEVVEDEKVDEEKPFVGPPDEKVDMGVKKSRRLRRKPKRRRDRRFVEEDEWIAVDAETLEKVVKRNRAKAIKEKKIDPSVHEVVLESDEFIDEVEVVRTGWSKREKMENAMPAPAVRATLKNDEYIDDGPRLRAKRRRDPLPPDARLELAPDEYIDGNGVVRANPRIRRQLEKEPPKDFEQVEIEEESWEDEEEIVRRGWVMKKPKRRPRRDKKHVEEDEDIQVDLFKDKKRVRRGKRARVAKGKPVTEVTLESEEWIDEYDEVRIGWKQKDQEERLIPARPVKATLKEDEYIDESGRLRAVKKRDKLPPGAVQELESDEYIDEAGVVRVNRKIRKRLDRAPPADFGEVVEIQSESFEDEEDIVITGWRKKQEKPDVPVKIFTGIKRPKMRKKRRPKCRRDRRHAEADEYVAVDAITMEKVVRKGKKREAQKRKEVVVEIVEEEWIDEFDTVTVGWSKKDKEQREGTVVCRIIAIRGPLRGITVCQMEMFNNCTSRTLNDNHGGVNLCVNMNVCPLMMIPMTKGRCVQ